MTERRANNGGGAPAAGRLSLKELTETAGVSVRTVRYYIAEGLLPPPAGAGPGSHYTAVHLDRLRLIAHLKTAYLPLKEIRRRLAGQDDAEVRRLLAASDAAASPPAPETAADLAHLLGTTGEPATVPSVMPPVAPRFEAWGLCGGPPPPDAGSARGVGLSVSTAYEPANPAPAHPAQSPILGRAYPATLPPKDEPPPDEPVPATESWRRIPLGDDAELLIRESAYRRRPDRVEWLLAWARKVFG